MSEIKLKTACMTRIGRLEQVRVSTAESPFRLGLAVATGGATTLCLLEGNVRGSGNDRVQLVLREGRYVAVGARGARALSGNQGRRATSANSRKN